MMHRHERKTPEAAHAAPWGTGAVMALRYAAGGPRQPAPAGRNAFRVNDVSNPRPGAGGHGDAAQSNASGGGGSAAASGHCGQASPSSGQLDVGAAGAFSRAAFARVSTHFNPTGVHSSTHPASTSPPRLASTRLIDGANTSSSAASNASRAAARANGIPGRTRVLPQRTDAPFNCGLPSSTSVHTSQAAPSAQRRRGIPLARPRAARVATSTRVADCQRGS